MTTNARVVAIIPARYASQRLPGKPLAIIDGRPMICHVFERAALAASVGQVIVATDDQRIAAAVRDAGGTAVLTPSDLRSGTDRVAAVAQGLPDADIVVNVQGDEPLLDPGMIDEAVAPLIADASIPAGTLVRVIDRPDELMNPGIPKVVIDRAGFCLYFSRSAVPFVRDAEPASWLAEQTFYKHIGLYVFRRDFLLRYAALPQTPLEKAENLEQLRILEHGFRIKATVTTRESIAVDTPEDLERVRALMAHRNA